MYIASHDHPSTLPLRIRSSSVCTAADLIKMAHKPTLVLAMWVCVTLYAMARPGAEAGDAEPLQDFCVALVQGDDDPGVNGFPCKPVAETTGEDFKTSVLSKPGSTHNLWGSGGALASAATFPGLNTFGASMVRADFARGGIGPIHTHPRGTELFFLVEGTLEVGFVSARGNKLYNATLHAGDAFVFPRGLLHFQKNVGEGHAWAIVAFDSQNAGVQLLGPGILASGIPSDVLELNFNIDRDTAELLQTQTQAILAPAK